METLLSDRLSAYNTFIFKRKRSESYAQQETANSTQ